MRRNSAPLGLALVVVALLTVAQTPAPGTEPHTLPVPAHVAMTGTLHVAQRAAVPGPGAPAPSAGLDARDMDQAPVGVWTQLAFGPNTTMYNTRWGRDEDGDVVQQNYCTVHYKSAKAARHCPQVKIVEMTGAGVRPIRVTTAMPHGLNHTGTVVQRAIKIHGVVGNEAANSDTVPGGAEWPITRISDTEFSIPATGSGAYISGGIVTKVNDVSYCTERLEEYPVQINIALARGFVPTMYGAGEVVYMGGGHGGMRGNRAEIFDITTGRWRQTQYKPSMTCQIGGATGPPYPTPPGDGATTAPDGSKVTPNGSLGGMPWAEHTTQRVAYDHRVKRWVFAMSNLTFFFDTATERWTPVVYGTDSGASGSPVTVDGAAFDYVRDTMNFSPPLNAMLYWTLRDILRLDYGSGSPNFKGARWRVIHRFVKNDADLPGGTSLTQAVYDSRRQRHYFINNIGATWPGKEQNPRIWWFEPNGGSNPCSTATTFPCGASGEIRMAGGPNGFLHHPPSGTDCQSYVCPFVFGSIAYDPVRDELYVLARKGSLNTSATTDADVELWGWKPTTGAWRVISTTLAPRLMKLCTGYGAGCARSDNIEGNPWHMLHYVPEKDVLLLMLRSGGGVGGAAPICRFDGSTPEPCFRAFALKLARPALAGPTFCDQQAAALGAELVRCVDFKEPDDARINWPEPPKRSSTHLFTRLVSQSNDGTGALHWRIRSYEHVRRLMPGAPKGEAWLEAIRGQHGGWRRWMGRNFTPGVTYYFQWHVKFNAPYLTWWGGGGPKFFGLGPGCRTVNGVQIPAVCEQQRGDAEWFTLVGGGTSMDGPTMTTTNWWPATVPNAARRPYPVAYQGATNFFSLTHGFTPTAFHPRYGNNQVEQPGPDANGRWNGSAIENMCHALARLNNPDYVINGPCVTVGAPDVWHQLTVAIRPSGNYYNFDPNAPASEKIFRHDSLFRVWYDGKLLINFDPDEPPFRAGQPSKAACAAKQVVHPAYDDCRTGIDQFRESRDLPLDCRTQQASRTGKCGSPYPVYPAPWIPGDPGADTTMFGTGTESYRRGYPASAAWCDRELGRNDAAYAQCLSLASSGDEPGRFEAFLSHDEVNVYIDNWIVATRPLMMNNGRLSKARYE